MRKSGFSLIELLVVVAIIGILGGIGIVGYQVYISQARDATSKDNFEFLKRTLDQDIVSVSNDLASRSKFSEGLRFIRWSQRHSNLSIIYIMRQIDYPPSPNNRLPTIISLQSSPNNCLPAMADDTALQVMVSTVIA